MARAGQVFFPLDERWGIGARVYSPERVKQMTWLAGVVPYAQAVQVFERIGHVTLPITSLWEQTQIAGQALQTHQLAQQATVSVERVSLPPAGQDHPEPKGVSLDGGTLHVRGEGWKEFKVGTVYDLTSAHETDPETGEEIELARGVNMAYRAVVGSVDDFAPALWALAVERAVPQAAEVVVTADGAEWIWNLVADYFPESVQIVDWYHATDHVAQAATALYPTDATMAQRWNHERRHGLYLGQVHDIATPLVAAGLASHAHYFHTHQRRMQYQEFREQGFPIGSGTVESGIKQFKQRLTGAGMRWSRPAAERMLVIRAAVMTDNFDTLWAAALN